MSCILIPLCQCWADSLCQYFYQHIFLHAYHLLKLESCTHNCTNSYCACMITSISDINQWRCFIQITAHCVYIKFQCFLWLLDFFYGRNPFGDAFGRVELEIIHHSIVGYHCPVGIYIYSIIWGILFVFFHR